MTFTFNDVLYLLKRASERRIFFSKIQVQRGCFWISPRIRRVYKAYGICLPCTYIRIHALYTYISRFQHFQVGAQKQIYHHRRRYTRGGDKLRYERTYKHRSCVMNNKYHMYKHLQAAYKPEAFERTKPLRSRQVSKDFVAATKLYSQTFTISLNIKLHLASLTTTTMMTMTTHLLSLSHNAAPAKNNKCETLFYTSKYILLTTYNQRATRFLKIT